MENPERSRPAPMPIACEKERIPSVASNPQTICASSGESTMPAQTLATRRGLAARGDQLERAPRILLADPPPPPLGRGGLGRVCAPGVARDALPPQERRGPPPLQLRG